MCATGGTPVAVPFSMNTTTDPSATATTTTDPVQVTHLDAEGTALHCQYKGQSAPQPCFIELHCETRTLSAAYNPEVGNAVPMWVWHNRILRWAIPVLTDDAANALLDELAAEAAIICDGYSCEWDGHNHVGRFTEAAKAAEQQIDGIIQGHSWIDRDQVQIWDAGEWYVDSPDKELGISAETTDDQIRALAVQETAKALEDGYNVSGIEEYLTGRRDAMRE